MIGHHDQQRVVVDLLHHPADQLVHPHVQLTQHVLVTLGVLARVGRMIVLEIAKEHVLQAVGDIEDAGHRPPSGLLHRIEQHLLALVMDQVGQFEEGLLVQHALVQPPGVLGQTQRGITTQRLGKIDRIGERVRDGQRRLVRIDVDRCHVELQMRRRLLEVETADALHRVVQRRTERQFDPRREFLELQRERLVPYRQQRVVLTGADLHLERQTHLPGILDQRVFGTRDVALDLAVPQFDRNLHAAREAAAFFGVAAVIREGPLTALQVGHHHRRQQRAAELPRRESDRHADDRTEDAVIAEDLPERLALAPQIHRGLPQRDPVLAQLQDARRVGHLGRAEFGKVRVGPGNQEVEDLVLARVAAGLKAGPGHRGLRRVGALQTDVGALLLQLAEVGQDALLQESVGQFGVLTVETDDDDPAHPGAGKRLSHLDRPHHPAEGKCDQLEEGEEKGRENDKKRGDESETGPGADIRLGRRRVDREQQQGQQHARSEGM